MGDQLEMYPLQTLQTLIDVTSLQESGCGITHLTSRDGRKVLGFEREVARVSRIVPQVDKKVRQTIDTYGLNGNASSKSVALQLSLESKLRTRFPSGGLTMFIKGWKRKATPSGRLYCLLLASARPIDEKDYGLWPTPRVSGRENAETVLKRKGINEVMNHNLTSAVQAALWATPNAADQKGTTGGGQGKSLRSDAYMMRGQERSGSTALMESKGSLNPEFPFWLMGIPSAWVSSIVRGMQSYHKSPRSLSIVCMKLSESTNV